MSLAPSSNWESLQVGVLQFPGSNCDADCIDTLSRHFSIKPKVIWHETTSLPKLDAVVVPGGFSFGDYLRSGALASHSPVVQELKEFVETGGAVIGICNGFQILVESKILPGMLLHNDHLKFVCKSVSLTDWKGRRLKVPIAHGEGRYYADASTLAYLERDSLVAYRYCDDTGLATKLANPNGAANNIAGIFSKNRRVLGMMPHPERATDLLMGGSKDGLTVWQDFFERI
jgi:phosphoribosylformylglycinamidine synthase